jgi:hypothetical protein
VGTNGPLIILFYLLPVSHFGFLVQVQEVGALRAGENLLVGVD